MPSGNENNKKYENSSKVVLCAATIVLLTTFTKSNFKFDADSLRLHWSRELTFQNN